MPLLLQPTCVKLMPLVNFPEEHSCTYEQDDPHTRSNSEYEEHEE
jgi:hypothetical protein